MRTPRSCGTCMHEKLSGTIEPCSSCRDVGEAGPLSNWEPPPPPCLECDTLRAECAAKAEAIAELHRQLSHTRELYKNEREHNRALRIIISEDLKIEAVLPPEIEDK